MRRLRIAVLGRGRAGQARARALAERDDAELAAQDDPALDALCICTPNLLHAEAARGALAKGRHILVEYPLAPSAAEARELYALAAQGGRVLQEEHIELLSPTQVALRARAAALGRPRSGEVRFSGDLSGWIAESSLAGSPALLALARLHRLIDLFGEADVRAASLARDEGWTLRVELAFRAGGAASLVEHRARGAARETSWSLECERGSLETPSADPAAGLFARDLDVFVARIRGTGGPYVSEGRCLHALELVEAIERRLG